MVALAAYEIGIERTINIKWSWLCEKENRF